MKNTKHIIAAALVLPSLLLLNSCKKENPENPTTSSTIYHQSYIVTYDKNEKTTDAVVTFRTNNSNGVIHKLAGNESLNINREIAGYNELDRKYYFGDNKFVNVEFIFTKNSGYQFLNTIKITDTSDAQFPSVFPTSINKASGMTVDWDGKPVDSNERLLLIIKDDAHAPVERYYANGKFIFTSGDLNTLTAGDVKISLERIKTLPIQSSDSAASGERVVIVRTSRMITLL
jgi:hypothetical protein